MNQPTRENNSVQNGSALPISLIGAALLAMAALYITSGRFAGLPVMAALLMLSRFFSWRLPKYFVITYGSRAVILVVLFTLMNDTQSQDVTVWYLKQEDTNLVGIALAADIVLRAWERRDPLHAREGLGVVILMTAFVFAAATNTYDRLHIQLIAPFYLLLLLLTFRGFSLMKQPARHVRRLRRPQILARAGLIFFALGFSAAIIFAVTRYEYQVTSWAMQFVRQRGNQQHEIGFSTSPQLSRIFNPQQSIARVLVIDGEMRDPYLRMIAFDTYSNQQWLPTQSDRAFATVPKLEMPPKNGAHLLNVTRLADTADVLAVPLTSAAVQCDDPLDADSLGVLRDAKSGSGIPYQIFDSTDPTFQGPLARKPDAKARTQLLAIPREIDPKVIDLAKEVAGAGETSRKLFRLQEYLRAHHQYALAFDPRGEPLDDFILNDRAAHCQYFASALAIMARAIGVPSRYVAGFYAHESYGANQTVVRDRDAHAWAECWIDSVGWVTLDATPTGGRPSSTFADPPAWKRWWEKLGDVPGQLREWFVNHAGQVRNLLALVATAGLGLQSMRLLLRRRKIAVLPTPRYPQPAADLQEMSRQFEVWMNTHGIACPPTTTWRSHISNRLRSPGKQIQLCSSFIQSYDRARFGTDGGEATATAQLLLQQIKTMGDLSVNEEPNGSADR